MANFPFSFDVLGLLIRAELDNMMMVTWTPALLQASRDLGLVSTKGQFSGTSDSLVKLSSVSRGGGGGGDILHWPPGTSEPGH